MGHGPWKKPLDCGDLYQGRVGKWSQLGGASDTAVTLGMFYLALFSSNNLCHIGCFGRGMHSCECHSSFFCENSTFSKALVCFSSFL